MTKYPDWFENYDSLTSSQLRTINDSICSLKGDIKNLKENHLAHLDQKLTEIETNQNWLIKSYWVIVGITLGSITSSVLTLIFK